VTPPKNFSSSRKRRLWEEAQQVKDVERAHNAEIEIAYEEYQSQVIDRYIADLPPHEYQQMVTDARRQLKRTYATMTPAQHDDLAANWVRAEVKNSGRVRMLAFEEFCRQNAQIDR
jgi:hypothetical protein